MPDLRALAWARDVLYFLTWRDVKVRYKQTAIGAAWAILQPLTAMLIFTLVFSRLASLDSEGVPYPIFAYCALVPWTFFATAVTQASGSLVLNETLITKFYFPRLSIPGSIICAEEKIVYADAPFDFSNSLMWSSPVPVCCRSRPSRRSRTSSRPTRCSGTLRRATSRCSPGVRRSTPTSASCCPRPPARRVRSSRVAYRRRRIRVRRMNSRRSAHHCLVEA